MDNSAEPDLARFVEIVEQIHEEIMRDAWRKILKAAGLDHGRSQFIYEAIHERRKERQGYGKSIPAAAHADAQ